MPIIYAGNDPLLHAGSSFAKARKQSQR